MVERKIQLEADQHTLDNKIEAIAKDSEILNLTLGNAESCRRNLDDNIRLKALQLQITEIDKSLVGLEAKVCERITIEMISPELTLFKVKGLANVDTHETLKQMNLATSMNVYIIS